LEGWHYGFLTGCSLDELGRRGLLEWAVVDPGSVNVARYDGIGRGEPGFIYLNPSDHIREGLLLARLYGFRPSFAIYEPGFTRLGAALAATFPGLPVPVYRFMFSDEFAWEFPPKAYALDAHLALLGAVAVGAPWMVAGLGVDIEPLIAEAVARGGHVRIGLEDARFGCPLPNVRLIKAAVRSIEAAGGVPASANDTRRDLVSLQER
jgi:3-keto-5-aminohexanoate cleavage enzyme